MVSNSIDDVTQLFNNGGDIFNNQVRYTSQRILNHLPLLLKNRLSTDRPDLFPGSHWLWHSLRRNLYSLTAILVINHHLKTGERLIISDNAEELLLPVTNFIPLVVLLSK